MAEKLKKNKQTSKKNWKIKDTSKMKEAQQKRWLDLNERKKASKRQKGRQPALGKRWKVKDTSNMNKDKKGKIFSEKHRENIRKSKKGKKPNWKNPKERAKNVSLSKMGEKNWNWKDGKTYIRKLEYKEKIAGRKRPDQCEICGAFGKIVFDHNHLVSQEQTKESFRGWICQRCNMVLGFIKDNRDLLNALIEYLNKNNASTIK